MTYLTASLSHGRNTSLPHCRITSATLDLFAPMSHCHMISLLHCFAVILSNYPSLPKSLVRRCLTTPLPYCPLPPNLTASLPNHLSLLPNCLTALCLKAAVLYYPTALLLHCSTAPLSRTLLPIVPLPHYIMSHSHCR
jgi:hypothetical protein